MKIIDILSKKPASYSFEFFPPKSEEGWDQLFRTIESLKVWKPAYVSVTYGAGGSNRRQTIDLVSRIKHEVGLESMAHLTCVESSQDEMRETLDCLKEKGIENVLPLRGDPPKGETSFIKAENGFGYASELVKFIRDNHYPFCLGVAGYPEGHLECGNLDKDIENLKKKVDAGADFIITQLFFDNRFFFDFVDKVNAAGINIPILPGIMPIINVNQVKKFTKMCGASIPNSLIANLEKVQDNSEEVQEIGVEHATQQCDELIQTGVPGIHFYTLNRSNSTFQILENLKCMAET
jgi:methylenetetrahydrofolate reductase (NADPH)